MHTQNVWVPRPAATKSFDFTRLPGSTGPFVGEALIEIGDRVYGWIASSRFPGHSEPFCYDYTTGTLVAIHGLSAANTPVSTPATGPWTPPTISRVGPWVLFTHPGFSLPHAFGWLDQTSFTDTATGDLAFGSVTVSNLSKDVQTAGWRPGQVINDSNGSHFVIPSGTVIVSIARDGLSLQMSQPAAGPATLSGDILTVTGGTPANPLWSAGNLSLNPLPGVASSVQIFNGRAWYAVKNATAYSDSGDPLVATNANQVITLQNGIDITAQATIPFNNATVIGGIVNALLLFQGDAGIWQVTGDQATSNVALNFLSPLGTLAPLTLTSCPLGLFFIAPDGLRIIQLDGTVSEPISANGDGVAVPFINATYPSRMCAAFNEDVLRISVTGESTIGGSATPDITMAEYWFHMKLKAWSGPHSFPAKLINPSNRPHTNHGFLMFPLSGEPLSGALETGGDGVLATGHEGVLMATGAAALSLPEVWFSNTRPLIDSFYIENGEQMEWRYATTLLPDTLQMFQNLCVETSLMVALAPPDTIDLSGDSLWDSMVWDTDVWDGKPPESIASPGQTATVRAYNEAGVVLAQAQITGFMPFAAGTQLPNAPASFWDTLVFSKSVWTGDLGGAIPAQRRVPWPNPVVFKQMIIEITGTSSPRVALGNVYLRYQQLGYMIQDYSTLAAKGAPGAPPVSPPTGNGAALRWP